MHTKRLKELVALAIFVEIIIEFSSAQSWKRLRVVNKYPQKMGCLDAVKTEGVMPDVVDNVPSNVIEVNYPSGVMVELGHELTPTQVKDLPSFNYNADNNKLYSIVMVDPDAPSRQDPKMRQMLHMLIANIPGKDVYNGDILAQYVGSGPPQGTGLHRYIFLLYEQKGKVVTDMKISNKSRVGRAQFNHREFAKIHNLGQPIAINFFQAQYDDYVPILHAQLSSGQ